MLRLTIRKRILGIAIGLIFLMAITSALSTVMTRRIAHQLDELGSKYVEAYGHLARMNVRSLEQALALRRMVAARTQSPPDDAGFEDRKNTYEAKGLDIDREAEAARALINAIIDDPSTESDNARLGRIDDRIEQVANDIRRYLGEEYKRILPLLEAGKIAEARVAMVRSDTASFQRIHLPQPRPCGSRDAPRISNGAAIHLRSVLMLSPRPVSTSTCRPSSVIW
ncbi:hypothetical protein ACFIOY_01565 [Bradyrhizobium sp. TZ2]